MLWMKSQDLTYYRHAGLAFFPCSFIFSFIVPKDRTVALRYLKVNRFCVVELHANAVYGVLLLYIFSIQ